MARRTSQRLAEKNARTEVVRADVFSTPELLGSILKCCIKEPLLDEPGNNVSGVKASNTKTFGRVASVCKGWAFEMRGTPDMLRTLLCTNSQTSGVNMGDVSKALALPLNKIKAYPYTRTPVGKVGVAYMYPMPETFDAILRDHGKWRYVLDRFKRNAKKAIEKEFFKQCEMACPIYQEKERSRAVLEATLGAAIAGKKGKAPTEDELRRVMQIKDACASFLAAHGLGSRAP